MFGLNDSSSQSTDSNSQPDDRPAVIHDNPAPVSPAPDPAMSMPTPLPPLPEPSGPPEIGPVKSSAPPLSPSSAGGDELMDIKARALQSLQPLVGHLNQTPEEKFKTTMMLIQATDNPSLVKEAYDAANQITDEKTRARALLDVVNEINYFTQGHTGEAGD